MKGKAWCWRVPHLHSLNQFVFKTIQPAENWIRSRSSLARKLEQSVDPLAELPVTVSSSYVTDHIIIVGYGRVGSRIGQALTEKKLAFSWWRNRTAKRGKLRKTGLHAVAGDSADPVGIDPSAYRACQSAGDRHRTR